MRMGIHMVYQLAFAVMLTAVLCLGSVVHPSVAHATVYYVATTGNDNNSCSTAQNISTPKGTIAGSSGALHCLSPGDTLDIRAGTYTEGNANYGTLAQDTGVIIPSGTSSARITFQGHAGETITWTNGLNIQNNVDASGVSYLTFDHLSMPGVGLRGNVHHIRISNGNFDCSGCSTVSSANVMQMTDVSVGFIEVLNNLIHNAPVTQFSPPDPITTSNYGVYFSGHDSLFDGNTIYNNTGSGLIIYHDRATTVSNNIVRNNVFYGNAFMDGTRGNLNDALSLASGSNNIAYNNVIYSNGDISHSPPGGGGLSAGFNCSGCRVYNNTVYGNVGIGLQASNTTNTTFTNNITFRNGVDRIVDWGTNPGITATTNLCGDNTGMSCILTTAPQFVNAAGHDFHLQAGSPAIDAGTTVSIVTTDIAGVSRPQGSAYDIGACEWGSLFPTPSNLRIASQ